MTTRDVDPQWLRTQLVLPQYPRASRYDPSDPARWWRSRADLRFVGFEWIKLVLYRLGLAE